MSSLNLHNTHTHVRHIFNINSSEAKSQYAVKGLQPGTRFKAEVVVTMFLEHLDLTVKQTLGIGMETGIVNICIYLTAGKVESASIS